MEGFIRSPRFGGNRWLPMALRVDDARRPRPVVTAARNARSRTARVYAVAAQRAQLGSAQIRSSGSKGCGSRVEPQGRLREAAAQRDVDVAVDVGRQRLQAEQVQAALGNDPKQARRVHRP